MLKINVYIITLAGICLADPPEDKCKVMLRQCLARLPLTTPGGLPVTTQEVDNLCKAYKVGNDCVESWSQECLSSDKQRAVQQQRQGVTLLMGLLCDDQSFRKGYMNHTDCFKSVSGDWDRCLSTFQSTAKHIADMKAVQQDPTRKRMEMCCASYGFNRCISMASRAKCSRSSAVLLRRMSETLSADSARAHRCETLDVAVCAAGAAAPALALLAHALALLLYFQH